jgi:hypothetical protein
MSILSQILLILFKTHQAGRRPTYFEHVFVCSWHVQPDSFERGWAMPWATMLVLVLVLHQRCGVCILFVLFAGCVFVSLPAFHLFFVSRLSLFAFHSSQRRHRGISWATSKDPRRRPPT